MLKEESVIRIIDELLDSLPKKQRDILIKRFALKKEKERKTLESIGKEYGVTRERVRQVEILGRKMIVETEDYLNKLKNIEKELKKRIDGNGGILPEKDLIKEEGKLGDYLNFILNISDSFYDVKKKDIKEKLWYTEKKSYEAFEKSLNKLYKDLKTDEILTEKEIINKFIDNLSLYTDNKKLLKNETVKRLISISKKIGSNPLGQWGRADSRIISTKSVRDYIYLVLTIYKKPMHFSEISEKINEHFQIKNNVATVHNELIRDERFILVGRGYYALKEWGKFSDKTVKEVIIDILKESGKPLSRDEIVEKVLKLKKVRRQTVLINLSSGSFKRTEDGKFVLA